MTQITFPKPNAPVESNPTEQSPVEAPLETKTAGTKPDNTKPDPEDKGKLELIIAEAQKLGTFFNDEMEQACVSVLEKSHIENYKVNSELYKKFLRYWAFKNLGLVTNKTTLQTALDHLSSICRYEGETKKTHVRVGEKDGNIYLDLCDRERNIVEITPLGWQVIKNSPVIFIRTPLQSELPIPISGGNLRDLQSLLGIDDEGSFIMLASWLVFALTAKGPYPFQILNGQEGSGKSTKLQACKALIDPSPATSNSVPGSARDLFIHASNVWILDYDNLSACPEWLSNCLCLVATGGTNSPRELYTNDNQVIFKVRRPVILSGIGNIATRPDFADRSVIHNFQKIPENKRLSERVFWERFNAKRPELLGALCDAVSCGLRNIKNLQSPNLPRMADFAEFILAAEDKLPWGKGAFLRAYNKTIQNTVEITLEADPVATAVISLMSNGNSYMATPANMLIDLGNQPCINESIRRSSLWPKIHNKLREKLVNAAGFLSNQSIMMNLDRKHNDGLKYFVFWKVGESQENAAIDNSMVTDQEIEPELVPASKSPIKMTVAEILAKLDDIPLVTPADIDHIEDQKPVANLLDRELTPEEEAGIYKSIFED